MAEQKTAILYRMILPEHTCPFGVRAKQMLEAAGYAVAMENAPMKLQAVADEITTRCEDGGVAQVLYGLIRKYGEDPQDRRVRGYFQ